MEPLILNREIKNTLYTWAVLMISCSLLVVPLPEFLSFFRPPWLSLSVIFFSIMTPAGFGVISAFIIGLLADVLQGNIFGGHAMTLSLIAYLSYRFHLQIRVFPLWQMMLSILLMLLLNELLVLWVEGIQGQMTFNYIRWLGIIIGTLIWPIFMAFLLNLKSKIL
jgi:rod shape-determining protein MreD